MKQMRQGEIAAQMAAPGATQNTQGVFAQVAQRAATWRSQMKAQAGFRHLASLDGRALSDLGLSRADLARRGGDAPVAETATSDRHAWFL